MSSLSLSLDLSLVPLGGKIQSNGQNGRHHISPSFVVVVVVNVVLFLYWKIDTTGEDTPDKYPLTIGFILSCDESFIVVFVSFHWAIYSGSIDCS